MLKLAGFRLAAARHSVQHHKSDSTYFCNSFTEHFSTGPQAEGFISKDTTKKCEYKQKNVKFYGNEEKHFY